MRRQSIASLMSLALVLATVFLAAVAFTSCVKPDRRPECAEDYIYLIGEIEDDNEVVSLSKRIWLYEELLERFGDELTPEQQMANRMKLEACQRNYFAYAFRDNEEAIRKDDLEQQAKAWQERYEQLARLTESLKAENTMLRNKAVRLEETLNGIQSRGDKKK